MEKNNKYYVERMIKYIDLISIYYERIKLCNKEIQADDQDSDGIIYKFNQLREEAKNVDSKYLENNKEIKNELIKLTALRNRLIHDYENVTYLFLKETIENDLPNLRLLLIESLRNK